MQCVHWDSSYGFDDCVLDGDVGHSLLFHECQWSRLDAHFWVNGVKLRSGHCPENLTLSNAEVLWRVDTWFDDTRASWRVCMRSERSTLFTTSGPCESKVQPDGTDCITSPFYPKPYKNSQSCEMRGDLGCIVNAEHFDTEVGFDFLVVNNRSFAGLEGPAHMTLQNSTISWSSDVADIRSGWKLCADRCSSSTTSHSDAANATAGPSSVSGLDTIEIWSIILVALGLFACGAYACWALRRSSRQRSVEASSRTERVSDHLAPVTCLNAPLLAASPHIDDSSSHASWERLDGGNHGSQALAHDLEQCEAQNTASTSTRTEEEEITERLD
eukprot:TRINITY_DN56685_c0_g1_i1.p1 TRINITY_DN56685_c0_g1~~TRINITY_DN56685_c0_g1_i1.p1  ORF type:complete len:329 (-),score=25.32 TRINITY_DN56685_c0_g1_i1:338-1324(-)